MIFEIKTDVGDGEPSAACRIRPQNEANEINAKIGASATDKGADGFQLTMGSLLRLAISMLPGDTQLELVQNTTTIKLSVTEFLLQFGDGTFTFNNDELRIVKGSTTVTIDATSLGIATQALTLTLDALTVSATGAVAIEGLSLTLQQYHFVTVVERLNALLLIFASHTHTVGPAPTTTPIGNPLNEKGFPIAAPVIVGEPPKT